MNKEDFKQSINEEKPPKELALNLQALWYDAKGDWHKAHEIVQKTSGLEGDWIHAYLHRKEGDLGNASYWYARVDKTRPDISLQQEWEDLLDYLLK